MSVKREEIDKIGQEIQNLKASKELTEQQKESLIISTAQSVLTQKMQRAVMKGELKLQNAQIIKMGEDIAHLGHFHAFIDCNGFVANWFIIFHLFVV